MKTFFIPGPVEVSEEVLAEMSKPMIGHRGKEYAELHEEVVSRMKKLFDWNDYYVFLITSSATGAMEGATRNCVDKKIMHTVCGAFSELWTKVSQENGKETIVVETEWGKAIRPEMLIEPLKKHKPEAIALTYCETSTGVLNPLKDLCETIKENSPDTLILVDAVSAFGGAPLDMNWGIDVMFFGVQKSFALPPGLAVAVVSKRALERSMSVKNKGYYFNFEIFAKYSEKNNTPSTPAISLIRGLRKQLQRIEEEGLKNRLERHASMQAIMEEWMGENGLEFFSEERYRSPTVSALRKPNKVGITDMVSAMKVKGFTISGGYGKLKEETFRIGHMGEHNAESLINMLKNLEAIIK